MFIFAGFAQLSWIIANVIGWTIQNFYEEFPNATNQIEVNTGPNVPLILKLVEKS